MMNTSQQSILGKLDLLRIELVELAYALECKGQLEAADVAITTSARIEEFRTELESVSPAVVGDVARR
jgi:hypothetical protein